MIEKISFSQVSKMSRKIIKDLQTVVFVQVDELEQEEQMALINDLEKYGLNSYIDSDTLLPGILNEFTETSHIDVDRLINAYDGLESYEFVQYE